MKKLSLLLAASVAALWAADFWENKKFTEWSDKEVKKILNDSPWCHTFSVEVRRGGGGGGGNKGGGAPDRTPGMGGGGRGRSGLGNPGPVEPPQQQVVEATVIARWISALPVKQAYARAQFGSEAAENPDAKRAFEREEKQYTIQLIGLPRNMVRRGDQMKNSATLVLKGRDPLHAENAKAEMKENGVIFLTLYFPKEGHPLAADDGDLALELKLGNRKITRKFKLKNMVYNGKLEI